jgi:hypothetical protein
VVDFLTQHAYLLLGLALGEFGVWLTFFRARRTSREVPVGIGRIVWGPFWPSLSNYLAKRGGFTRREWIGWGIVLLIALLAIFFPPGGRS